MKTTNLDLTLDNCTEDGSRARFHQNDGQIAEKSIESPEMKPQVHWKRILVPIDFSEQSKEAVEIAVCLAERSGAKITLFHVVQLSGAESIETGRAAYEEMISASRSLDQIADEIPTPLVSQKLVCLGAGCISQKIVEMAREVSSDLIVLTTHACSFFKRILPGSTIEEVNRHAPCPVLVVRQNSNTNTKIV